MLLLFQFLLCFLIYLTSKDGYLILPEKIYPGEYIIYETNAPKGYYLDDEWRIPEEKADIGDATKGGKKIKIDKIATGLAEDAENPGQVQVGQYQYDANIYNTHLKANLLVEKKGKKLVNTTNGSATYKTTYDEEVKLTTVVPLYEEVGLEGVKFEIANAEGKVVDTITTDANGKTVRINENDSEALILKFQNMATMVNAGEQTMEEAADFLASTGYQSSAQTVILHKDDTSYPAGFFQKVQATEARLATVIGTNDYIFLVLRGDADTNSEYFKEKKPEMIEIIVGNEIDEKIESSLVTNIKVTNDVAKGYYNLIMNEKGA